MAYWRSLNGSHGKETSELDPVITGSPSQHRQLELLIARTREVKGETLAGLLVSLGELLEQHIRLEERKLFPLFESHMTPENAGEVGTHIEQVLKNFQNHRAH